MPVAGRKQYYVPPETPYRVPDRRRSVRVSFHFLLSSSGFVLIVLRFQVPSPDGSEVSPSRPRSKGKGRKVETSPNGRRGRSKAGVDIRPTSPEFPSEEPEVAPEPVPEPVGPRDGGKAVEVSALAACLRCSKRIDQASAH